VRAAALLALFLVSSCGRSTSYNATPPCVRNPEGTPLLTVQEANGLQRLWSKDACIPVTYAPSLETLKPTLQAALDAWDSVSCTGLCFDAPKPNKELPTDDRDRRLHVADTGAASSSAWEMLNDGRTGLTLHATIYTGTKATTGELLKQLGSVLGFQGQKTTKPRDTVLEEASMPNVRTTLGMLDSQSICAVYPSCR
jgi:hypothetical protein